MISLLRIVYYRHGSVYSKYRHVTLKSAVSVRGAMKVGISFVRSRMDSTAKRLDAYEMDIAELEDLR